MNDADLYLEPGDVLENRYRLIELLGGGGMGQVWAAQHLTLGHIVAIKVLRGSVMNSSEPRARFEREARLMARLGEMSRHIARVSEHGGLADGTPFLVMELLRGEGLDAALKREKVLALDYVAQIVAQLCKALTVAHAEGVVHRDIKPANIFLCVDEDGGLLVKLLDFGVAKARSELGGEQTVAGKVIGTPNYMAPEQLTGDIPIDHRADLFAVGSIAYRCATGKTPFGTASLSEMAVRIVTMTPRLPSSLNARLPVAFDTFAERALSKQPEYRFQTAKEVADALSGVLRRPDYDSMPPSRQRPAAVSSPYVALPQPISHGGAVTHLALSSSRPPYTSFSPQQLARKNKFPWGFFIPAASLVLVWFWPPTRRYVHRLTGSPRVTEQTVITSVASSVENQALAPTAVPSVHSSPLLSSSAPAVASAPPGDVGVPSAKALFPRNFPPGTFKKLHGKERDSGAENQNPTGSPPSPAPDTWNKVNEM